jgi:hypothetical protein
MTQNPIFEGENLAKTSTKSNQRRLKVPKNSWYATATQKSCIKNKSDHALKSE